MNAAAAASTPTVRVVIADDHRLFAESLELALSLEGYDVRRLELPDDGGSMATLRSRGRRAHPPRRDPCAVPGRGHHFAPQLVDVVHPVDEEPVVRHPRHALRRARIDDRALAEVSVDRTGGGARPSGPVPHSHLRESDASGRKS